MLSVVDTVAAKPEFGQVMAAAASSGAALSITVAHAGPVVAPLPQ